MVGTVSLTFDNINNTYNSLLKNTPDFNKTLPFIKEVSRSKKHVISFGEYRRGIASAVMIGQPIQYTSYDLNTPTEFNILAKSEGVAKCRFLSGKPTTVSANPSDLLIVGDALSSFNPILEQDLEIHLDNCVDSFIVLHPILNTLPSIISYLTDRSNYWQKVNNNSDYLTLFKRKIPSSLQEINLGKPGTKLKEILNSIGIHTDGNCNCEQRIVTMDLWGIEECKRRKLEIVNWLKEGYEKWGWASAILSLIMNVRNTVKLSVRISLHDPLGSLVDEAIRLAEFEIQPSL